MDMKVVLTMVTLHRLGFLTFVTTGLRYHLPLKPLVYETLRWLPDLLNSQSEDVTTDSDLFDGDPADFTPDFSGWVDGGIIERKSSTDSNGISELYHGQCQRKRIIQSYWAISQLRPRLQWMAFWSTELANYLIVDDGLTCIS